MRWSRIMWNRVGFCVFLVGLLSVPNVASAELYRWVFDQSVYQVDPGATVDVSVYLEEAIEAGDTPIFDSSQGDGLGSIGLAVYWNDAPPSDPAKVLNDSDVSENPAFDFVDTAAALADHAELNELILFNDPVYGVEDPTDTFRVLAGTFTFTAGSVAGEETLIRATDLDPGQDDTLDSLGNVALDSLIAEATATVNVVPEPGSLVLVLTGALGGLALLYRRAHRASRP